MSNDNLPLDHETRQKIMEAFLDVHTDILTDKLQLLYTILDVPSSKEVFMSIVLAMGIEALSTAVVVMGRESAQKVLQEVFNHEFRDAAEKSEHLRSMLTDQVVEAAKKSVEQVQEQIKAERAERNAAAKPDNFRQKQKGAPGFGQMAEAFKKAGFSN